MALRLVSNGTKGNQDWKYSTSGDLLVQDDKVLSGVIQYWLMPNLYVADVQNYVDAFENDKQKIEDEWEIEFFPGDPVGWARGRGEALSGLVSKYRSISYNFDAYRMCTYKDASFINIVYEDAPNSFNETHSMLGLYVSYDTTGSYITDVDLMSIGMIYEHLDMERIGLPNFDTQNECIAYLGTDPDPIGPDPGSSDGPSDDVLPDTNFEDINESFLSSLMVIAEIDQSNLDNIAESLNNRISTSSDLVDNLQKVCRALIQNNLADGILSVKTIPIPSGASLPYKTGSFETLFQALGGPIVAGKKLKNSIKKYVIGNMYISPVYGDYRDFLVEYSIYLPFSGIHRLDSDVIVGNNIIIKADIDFVMGSIMYHIILNKDTSERDIYQFTGDCGIEMPITMQDYSAKYQSIMSGVFSGVGMIAGGAIAGPAGAGAASIASGAISSGLNTVGNAATVQGNYIQSGKLVPNSAALSVLQPYLIISKPQDVTPNYASVKGKPCHKMKRLSDCSGFTIVSNINLNNIPNATDEDKDEIKSLLANGVIF